MGPLRHHFPVSLFPGKYRSGKVDQIGQRCAVGGSETEPLEQKYHSKRQGSVKEEE